MLLLVALFAASCTGDNGTGVSPLAFNPIMPNKLPEGLDVRPERTVERDKDGGERLILLYESKSGQNKGILRITQGEGQPVTRFDFSAREEIGGKVVYMIYAGATEWWAHFNVDGVDVFVEYLAPEGTPSDRVREAVLETVHSMIEP